MKSNLSYFPTGIEDVDREIFSQLDLTSIEKACQSNKYVNKLCDPWLWRLKFSKEYVDLGNNIDYRKVYYNFINKHINDVLIYSANNGYVNLVSYAIEHVRIYMQKSIAPCI